MTSIQPTGTQKQATEAASPSSTAPAVPTTKVSQRFGRKFEDLISLEFRRLHVEDHSQARGTENGRESPVISTPSPADEPWVVFTQHDHFGIALSGGGIRSATFNLGLLQGLDRNRVLDHVDYLSTVSGGGYVGGFWTAWKHTHRPQSAWHNGKPPKQSFPRGESGSGPQTDKSAGQREADEIRHLREFSRFIMPRVGFTQAETWSGIVAILAGMVPSLTAAAALVTLAFYGWFAANFFLIKADLQSTLAAAALSMFTMLVFCEARWRKSGKAGRSAGHWCGYLAFVALSLLTMGFFWWLWATKWISDPDKSLLMADKQKWLTEFPGRHGELSFLLFGPAVALSLTAGVLMTMRFVWSRFSGGAASGRAMIDRCAYRFLAPAIVWAGLAILWELSRWIRGKYMIQVSVGSGPVVFGGLFLWLHNWLAAPIKDTRGTRLLERLKTVLKPLIPQLLAAAAVLTFVIAIGVTVQSQRLYQTGCIPYAIGAAVAAIAGTLFLFNPERVGLHDFYRGRIARCFLGAARRQNQENENRATAEQAKDDVKLKDLAGGPPRPIHLVCCAANNIAGDILSGLYRGARSAVISPLGLSLGGYNRELDDLRFSSALTASAAAFNSQMGRVSIRLGPAVAIVMSALNLRLGLWVPHPLNRSEINALLPGKFFFWEMFGLTKCDPITRSQAGRLNQTAAATSSEDRQMTGSYLHLSDGAHFENLGLYELIRRHCRYVIVSDASADPEVAFDDLANTLRCIREDFGVEIELDVSPLRPGAEKRSSQHAVVGTIHYDGLSGTDKGAILYFKPTLTGDEPPDVLQYGTRNQAFPHESTGDQFYDEAQWESYRRLGEHAAHVVLRFLEKPSAKFTSFVENLFLEASQRWHPAPPRQEEIFLQLTERFTRLESEMRDNAPASLRQEFFPELVQAGFVQPSNRTEDATRAVYYVMLAAQVMEDAWVGAQLDIYWSHPLNYGWMSYCQRWASTPSFRRWWPILRPLYSQGFAGFVKERLNIAVRDPVGRKGLEAPGPGATLRLVELATDAEVTSGLAWKKWGQRFGDLKLTPEETGHILIYQLLMEGTRENPRPEPVQVGFIIYKRETDVRGPGKDVVRWQSSRLFVPHALVGAGIVARFLDAVITYFKDDARPPDELQVVLQEGCPLMDCTSSARSAPADPANRRERVQTIGFYKSRGFHYVSPAAEREFPTLALTLTVPARSQEQTSPAPPRGISPEKQPAESI